MKNKGIFALLLAVFLWVAPGASATTPESATNFIDGLSRQAFDALAAPGTTLEQKEAAVRALLATNFDLALIGRFVLGADWRKATPEQQEQYQSLFREFILRTYSRRLGGYTGQQFKIVGAKPVGKKDVLVTTNISRPSGPPIVASWRVREAADGHKILDVVVAGVSMVVTQRSEFRAVVRRQGVGGLIESLRVQVTKFSAQGN